jgi:hypothetical protein
MEQCIKISREMQNKGMIGRMGNKLTLRQKPVSCANAPPIPIPILNSDMRYRTPAPAKRVRALPVASGVGAAVFPFAAFSCRSGPRDQP